MKQYLFLTVLSAVTMFATAQTIKYVRPFPYGQPSYDGSSWNQATSDLQSAIDAVAALGGGSVWVSAGSYKPDKPSNTLSNNPKDNAFVLKKNVQIYGGFVGNETMLDQRNWGVNRTVLDCEESYYRVILSVGDVGSACLDGFVVRRGLHWSSDDTASITVNGYSIQRGLGAGVTLYNSSPLLINLEIVGHWAWEGSGIYMKNSSSTIINSLICWNVSIDCGGGLKCVQSSPTLINATIIGNEAAFGCGMANVNSYPKIYNSIINKNTKLGALDHDIENVSSFPEYRHSLVQGTTRKDTANNLNGNLDPCFKRPISGNYDLSLDSHSICFDKGDPTYLSGITRDLAGNSRIQGIRPSIGAYESSVASSTIKIMHVNPNVVGGDNSGTSWANATPNLLYALQQGRIQSSIEQIWVKGGICGLTSPNTTYQLPEGVKLYGGFAGNETSLDDRNLDLVGNPTILDGGNNAYHVVSAIACFDTTYMDGFIIRGGNAINLDNEYIDGNIVYHNKGGGLVVYASNLIVKNSIIKKNNAVNGGGTFCQSSSLFLENVTIDSNNSQGNSSDYGGGGIYGVHALIDFNTVTISNNTSQLRGGGLYMVFSTTQGKMAKIVRNQANQGGGVFMSRASSLRDLEVSDNYAFNNGGGVFNFVTPDSSSSLPALENMIVASNSAYSEGGGVFNYFSEGCTTSLVNLTVCKNRTASYDPINGICNQGFLNISNYTLHVYNSIFFDNTVPSVNSYYANSISDRGALFGVNNLPSNSLISFVDANNGNYRLNFNSALINKGDKNHLSLYNTHDADGNSRVIGNNVDLGAYEVNITPNASGRIYVNCRVVDTTGRGDSWSTALKELSTALHFAKGDPTVKEIFVACGTYKPMFKIAETTIYGAATTARHNAFEMVEGLSVYGGFNGTEDEISQRNLKENPTILSGNIGDTTINSDNCYHVVVFSDYGKSPTKLDGFIICDGNANGSISDNVYVNGGLIESDCGGGIYNRINHEFFEQEGYGLYVYNTIIRSNVARLGAGLFNVGSFKDYQTKNNNSFVYNSLIFSNIANYGAGIYNKGYNDFVLQNATIVNNKLSGSNHVKGGGGGIFNDYTDQHVTINNSIIQFNDGTNFAYWDTDKPLTNISYSLVKDETYEGPDTLVPYIRVGNLSGSVDPLFEDTAQQNYRLQLISPCINSGKTPIDFPLEPSLHASLDSSWYSSTIDLDSRPRVYDNIIDMGPYENQEKIVIEIIHVKKGGCGSQDGSNWANAVAELETAIQIANTDTSVKQIWVSDATYYPTTTNNRNISFVLPTNVKIFGGFPANADDIVHTSINDRDFSNGRLTILSGDIGALNNITDNSYHVVTAGDYSHLDGVTIENGNADGGGYNAYGGGLYASGSAELSNLTIRNNFGIFGGGVAIADGNSQLEHIDFYWNSVELDGGAIIILSGNSHLNQIYIFDNFANRRGGGLALINSSSYIENTDIKSNLASWDGGGVVMVDDSSYLNNINISMNTAWEKGGGLAVLGGCPFFDQINCYTNLANFGGGLYCYQTGLFAKFLHIYENYAGYGAGIYCDDPVFSPTMPVFGSISIHHNHASITGGIYNSNSAPLFANALIFDNTDDGMLPGRTIYNGHAMIFVHATIASISPPSYPPEIVSPYGEFHAFNSIICDWIYPPNHPLEFQNFIDWIWGPCLSSFYFPYGGNFSLITPLAINSVDITNVINYAISQSGTFAMPCSLPFLSTLLQTDITDNPRSTSGTVHLGAYEFDPNPNSNFDYWNPWYLYNSKQKSMDNNEEQETFLSQEIFLSQEASNWQLYVYPSPTTNEQRITVLLTNGFVPYNNSVYLNLFSIEGVLLFSQTHSMGRFTMELPNIAPGVYVVRLKTEEGAIYTGKLVVR